MSSPAKIIERDTNHLVETTITTEKLYRQTIQQKHIVVPTIALVQSSVTLETPTESKVANLSQDEYDRRRKLWEAIKILIKSEQEELYRILKRNEVEVTENTNGIFFDVGKLSQTVVAEIEKFLQFCQQNRVNFEQRDKEMENLRQEV
jgi:hypothetical protein